MHPVNKGLVPIHYKYFVTNLILHHFLLSPVAYNIRVSINHTRYTLSKLSSHGNIMKQPRIFWKTAEYSLALPCVCPCLEKVLISAWLVTLLHICGVIPTPQSPLSPETPRRCRRKVRASADVSASSADIIASNGECFVMSHNVLRVFHNVSQCFKCFMMFY